MPPEVALVREAALGRDARHTLPFAEESARQPYANAQLISMGWQTVAPLEGPQNLESGHPRPSGQFIEIDTGALSGMETLANPLRCTRHLVGAPPGVRFVAEGNSMLTIRATAQVRLPNGGFSDVKRTVAAMIKYMPPGYDSPIHVLRWYDTSFSDTRWNLAAAPIPFGAAAPPPTGSN